MKAFAFYIKEQSGQTQVIAIRKEVRLKRSLNMSRNYYLFLSGYFISSVGDWLYQLALPLLVYEITHSPLSMAVTYGLTFLPYIFFLPIGGVIADRVDRRRLLVFGDLTSAAVASLLAIAVWHGVQSMWLIYPAVFLLAGVLPLYHPAFQSFIPHIVHDDDLAKGNAWLQGSQNFVALIGPLISGVFIASIGATSAIFLDALSFCISALLIIAIRIPSAPKLVINKAKSSCIADMREGFSFIWRHPVIRTGSLLFFGLNLAVTLFYSNYMYFLIEELKFTSFQLGFAVAIPGLGAVIGAIVAPYFARRYQVGRLILGCTLIVGFMMLPLLFARSVFSIAIPWAIVTALNTISAVTWFTLRQRIVPGLLLGRVVALTRLIAFTSIPIAAIAGGVLLNATRNINVIIGIAAAVSILVGILGCFTPLYRSGQSRTDSAVVSEVVLNEVDRLSQGSDQSIAVVQKAASEIVT